MPATPLPIPKGFRRLNDFPLDASSIFPSLEALESYAATNATAYPGQACAVVMGEEVELYVLNAAKVPVIASGSGGGNSKAIQARQKILTGEGAVTIVERLSESIDGESLFHRPPASRHRGRRGWITDVSEVGIELEVLNVPLRTGSGVSVINLPSTFATGNAVIFDFPAGKGAPLQSGKTYYVVASGSGKGVALTPAGAPITLTQEITTQTVVAKIDPLVANQDFVFYPDRQCFYFLNPQTSGDIIIEGKASRNFINFGVTIEKSVDSASFATTLIDTSSPHFQITSVSVKSEDRGIETPSGFYFDHATSTLFMESLFTANAVAAFFQTNLGSEVLIALPGLRNNSRLVISKDLWPSISSIKFNGQLIDPAGYTKQGSSVNFASPLGAGLLEIKGPQITYTFANNAGNTIALPTELVAVNQVVLENASRVDPFGDTEDLGRFTPFAALEKTESDEDDILHIGWNYPTGQADGEFTVAAKIQRPNETDPDVSFIFKFIYWPGNSFEFPLFLDNVYQISIGGTTVGKSLVVFDAKDQKVFFCKKQSGKIRYESIFKNYEGLASGGETLEIVEEIPGIYATTCGTGHHISTLRTFDPPLDWYDWWVEEWERELVQIVDDNNIVIYQDETEGAFANSRPGYTAEELKPLTLKLPLAALWPLCRRDDTSLFQEAFTPNFATSTFNSATYPELDDTQRYAADSMGVGKSITLSTNKTAPVRGVQGATFQGPKPTYYAGKTIPYMVLATYKWFVVKCNNTNNNNKLTVGKKYLLCVNNLHMDSKAIMVNITNEGFNVAADLYELKEGN